jgi:hypothetical protein
VVLLLIFEPVSCLVWSCHLAKQTPAWSEDVGCVVVTVYGVYVTAKGAGLVAFRPRPGFLPQELRAECLMLASFCSMGMACSKKLGHQ